MEKMILESTLVLVLLVGPGGELGKEDHCSCIVGSQWLQYSTSYCGVDVVIRRAQHTLCQQM